MGRKVNVRSCTLLLAAFWLLADTSIAQDSHYWSHQYGGRAILLTGAVVGGISEASAAYYNPAGLAFAVEDEIFLGTQVFDLANIRIRSETGEETSLDSDDLGRAPSFLGGMAPLGLGTHRFAYAVFKRHSFDLRVDGFILNDEGESGPDRSSLFARSTFNTKLSERWFGGTWSYPLSTTLGIGISTFLARRQQSLEIERTSQVGSSTTGIVIRHDIDYYKYWHYRFLWKAGIELDLDQISFGLTVTTPGLKIYGSGERIVNAAQAGSLGGVAVDNYISVDAQEGVDVDYRSPVSAALGLSMLFEHRAVHVSVEVFDDVKPYTVLDLAPAFSQTTGEPIQNAIRSSSEGVVNAALGYEEYFSPQFKGFLSVSTDYSSAAPESVTNLSVTRWDLYHLTGGATFGVGDALFIVGLGYAFGSEKSDRIASPVYPPDGGLLPPIVPSDISYQRLKVIIGFSLST